MREDECLQSLHFSSLRMKDGSIVNMSLPIVLAIDDENKEGIGSSSAVGLVGPDGDLIAILRSIQIYKHNKEERIARTREQLHQDCHMLRKSLLPLESGSLEVIWKF